jgi:hypothetical protein
MPTLKPYTLPSRTSPHASQNLAKSMAFPTLTDKQDEKNNEGTTMAIRNAGGSANMRVRTFNKISYKLKGEYLKIPHYA